MKCAIILQVLTVLLGVSWVAGQFLNNRPYPTYSLEHMPDTAFTCRAKVLGGYYADSETQCQMFHVCVKVPGLGVQDFRFLCPNGTAFDQDSQICAEWDDVDCEAATLYYSSDNFDLYRLGSGFETAPFAGEDEGTFHLQRSDTGDRRLSSEKESIRVNQQTNYNTITPPKRPQFNKERDILRGSSSSNFFNNKNGGKENDEDYEDSPPNRNSNVVPEKKVIRKINKKPEVSTTQAPKPSVSVFSNNYAGSPNVPRVSSTTSKTVYTTSSLSGDQYTAAIQNYRGRQRGRNDRQRGNVRNEIKSTQYQEPSTTAAYNERKYNNQYREPVRNNDYNRESSRNTDYNRESTRNTDYNRESTINKDYNRESSRNTDYNRESQRNTDYNQRNQYHSSTSAYNGDRNQPNNQSSIQSTPSPFRKQERQYQNVNRQPIQNEQFVSSTSAPKSQYTQYDLQKSRQVSAVTNKQTTQFKVTENYQTTTQKQEYNKQANKEEDNYPTGFNFNKQGFYNQDVPKVQQAQTENYPTSTFNKQNFNNQFTQKKPTSFKVDYSTTAATTKKITNPLPKQTDAFDYNRQTTYNPGFNSNKQVDNTKYTNQQSTQYSTARPTTVHTQYTPTIPKQNSQFTYSTTQSTKFSKYDYDDGSYNPSYDDDKKQEDEFLKTAHSQNIASSRNELASKSSKAPVVTKNTRPISTTNSIPRETATKQTVSKNVPETTKKVETTKKEKDVSYDYAYYDTNVGSEPDYDVGTEFARSTKKV